MSTHPFNPGWLSEPKVRDDTWGHYGEALTVWLQRSTLPRAMAIRQFLRDNISALPQSSREHFLKELKEKWDSAFLELILARTIQITGGQFCLERRNAEGKRPDFRVDFGGHEVTIEAVSPVFDSEGDVERSRDAPLLELINTNAPRGWSINVGHLPNIGPADSKKEFKRILLEIFQQMSQKTEKRWYVETRELSSGRLVLSLFPDVLGHAPIVVGPMYRVLPVGVLDGPQ